MDASLLIPEKKVQQHQSQPLWRYWQNAIFQPTAFVGPVFRDDYYLCNYRNNKRSISKSKTFPCHYTREMKNSFVPGWPLVCFPWSHWEQGLTGLKWVFSSKLTKLKRDQRCHIYMSASLLILSPFISSAVLVSILFPRDKGVTSQWCLLDIVVYHF